MSGATDGWELAKISVRDLMAEADLHAEEAGGDFASEAFRLGIATAEVHADLATALGSHVLTADDMRARAGAMIERLDGRCSSCPTWPRSPTPCASATRPSRPARRSRCSACTVICTWGRCCARSPAGPCSTSRANRSSPSPSRREPDSPLRDVAGMLRSFDYAGYHQIVDSASTNQTNYRAKEWADRNRDAFHAGYAHAPAATPPPRRPVAAAGVRGRQSGVRGGLRSTKPTRLAGCPPGVARPTGRADPDRRGRTSMTGSVGKNDAGRQEGRQGQQEADKQPTRQPGPARRTTASEGGQPARREPAGETTENAVPPVAGGEPTQTPAQVQPPAPAPVRPRPPTGPVRRRRRDLDRLVGGAHHNPHDILGAHQHRRRAHGCAHPASGGVCGVAARRERNHADGAHPRGRDLGRRRAGRPDRLPPRGDLRRPRPDLDRRRPVPLAAHPRARSTCT